MFHKCFYSTTVVVIIQSHLFSVSVLCMSLKVVKSFDIPLLQLGMRY